MALQKIRDDDLIDRLADVFRQHGFEGASLSLLSRASGLRRASLYHRFPGGKEEMAMAVLARANQRFGERVLSVLAGPEEPRDRLERMAGEIADFYSGGRKSCLLDALSFQHGASDVRKGVESAFGRWIEALADLSREAGVGPSAARLRAEDAVIRIQGALVLSRASGCNEAFLRTLQELPRSLLTPEPPAQLST